MESRRSQLTAYQNVNPLDYLFYVGDTLRRRVGLPGVNILMLLDLGGRIDVAGFNQAIRAIHKVYPATAAALERSALRGYPRWRLGRARSSSDAWLETRTVDPPTEEELQRRSLELLHSPLDCVRRPPVQFVLLRGMCGGDVLAMRWPHFFMDARGGVILLEEIQRLYEEKREDRELASAGDELRDDVGEMLKSLSSRVRRAAVFLGAGESRASQGEALRLNDGPIRYDVRGLQYLVRTLDAEQTRRIRDAALRVCGFARMGDFVRACAIQALHRTLRPARKRGRGYTTMQQVDNRKRRQRGPVCHNFFSALPMYIPCEIADDRKATADRISEATARALSTDLIARRYAALAQLTHIPPSLLAELTRSGIRSGPGSLLGASLAKSPSLPMGFIGAFSRALPEFCGARWKNIYGMGVILPHEGFGLNVNTPNDPNLLNVTATYFEPRVSGSSIRGFLDRFIEALQDGG